MFCFLMHPARVREGVPDDDASIVCFIWACHGTGLESRLISRRGRNGQRPREKSPFLASKGHNQAGDRRDDPRSARNNCPQQ
jgi:hypothetical protein